MAHRHHLPGLLHSGMRRTRRTAVSTGFETFITGIFCGAVFGAAGAFSRRILGVLFGLAAAWMVFVAVEDGLPGLEGAVHTLIEEAKRHQRLVLGVAVGAVLAASLLSRSASNNGGS